MFRLFPVGDMSHSGVGDHEVIIELSPKTSAGCNATDPALDALDTLVLLAEAELSMQFWRLALPSLIDGLTFLNITPFCCVTGEL